LYVFIFSGYVTSIVFFSSGATKIILCAFIILSSCFIIYDSTRRSVQIRGTFIPFVIRTVLWQGIVSTSSNHQDGGPPLVGCLRLLVQYICSYHPYWSQPEDDPCRGDGDPLNCTLLEYNAATAFKFILL
jgi:hypothetical protein